MFPRRDVRCKTRPAISGGAATRRRSSTRRGAAGGHLSEDAVRDAALELDDLERIRTGERARPPASCGRPRSDPSVVPGVIT
jgi:hypothetical protein